MDLPPVTAAIGFVSLDAAYSFLAIILVLGGLIFFHELGHFLAAKAFRVGVKTFSLGFGPRLFGIKKGATDYQVAVFPLGGFVSMVGEADPADIPAPFTEKDSFALRSPWQRLIIIIAGPLFNLVLAWFLYWGIFYAHGQEFLIPEVGTISQNSPAMQAGLQPKDRILAVNGLAIDRWDQLVESVMESKGAAMALTVRRGGETLVVTATPSPFERKTLFGENKTSWAIGLGPSYAKGTVRFGFLEAGVRGVDHAVMVTKLIGESIVKMFERVVPLESMGGPIRIAKEIHQQAQSGSITGLLLLAAFISLNLGLLNLLPIPVLDGGHIVFLFFEMIRRKPASERFQEFTIRIGVALLLGLMVFVTYNDISKWIQGEL
ncbi:Membrane-associated zinc metalloprotease [uncultured delta proteobacterium]|uniref:Zinc metalloprotease n=1 Tax=uncultured delta proteobacterium TaxID=34034 RepID=A0A212JPU3_9DELT|nr:Membrane-associated zinc metalloprotease [uncultured delta proteobacterium]